MAEPRTNSPPAETRRPEEIEAVIVGLISRIGRVDRGRLTVGATLESLDLASIDFVNILLGIEEEFGIYLPMDESITDAKDVGELLKILIRRVDEKQPV
jgi:acyl carrier protein